MQHDIAVVGMVCRVPGADDTDAFWKLLVQGKEGIRLLTPEEAQSLPPHQQDNYIAAGGFVEGIDLFDAENFSFSAREATLMDPQHRLWLQACWQALEVTGQAGHMNPYVGVFACAGPNAYLNHILSNQSQSEQHQAILLGNVPDCLATRVSYSLNLTGPSMTIQCGCSSSLVALHQARLALLAKQCDAALVGGICLVVPSHQGYHYVEGGFASPDGHCRPFSQDAAGTVFSSGYGVVVVKRLADALADGDTIYAVIKGSAINNDGADKASFTAPGVNGQATVIAKALRVAGLTANDIQYIEAHGTGTPIGDPIELTALEQAFRQSTAEWKQRYHIGSVKANLGHLDVAAGIVSFIKTCLMLHHQTLTPQIHFNDWNKKCVNANALFHINTTLIPWEAQGKRRAGVSAFGFGGTNAHVIVEEAPEVIVSASSHATLNKLIVLSAKSSARLMQWVKTLRQYLQDNPTLSIDDLAYTLQTGRRQFAYRLLIQAHSLAECVQILGRVTEEDFVACKVNSEVKEIKNSSIHEIQQAWLSGHTLNWKGAYTGLTLKKIPLPAAPLQLTSYWFQGNAESSNTKIDKSEKNATDVTEWLYQAVWREKICSPSSEWQALAPILIFSHENDSLITALIEEFQHRKLDYYWVTAGERYQQWGPHRFQINPQALHDYECLERALSQEQRLPNLALIKLDIATLCLENSFPQNVLFNLVKQHALIRHIKQWTTLTVGMNQLYCKENHPTSAILTAFNRAIGQEFPNIKTQLIDLDPTEASLHTKQVSQSVLSPDLTDLCVWRDNKCWQFDYQSQPKSVSTEEYFKKKGVYLITGGLGNVASVHVDYLASEYQATLILIGRTVMPPASEWSSLLSDEQTDKKLKQKLARLQQWREAGYSVHSYAADITDKEAMHALCQSVITTWGQIDGIVHIAGAGSDMHYKMLPEIDWQHCWKLFAPKLLGITLLAELSERFSIPSCLVISSISSALTGIGLSAYGATHNVLDAMVSKHYPHWRMMNWDAWSFYQHEQKQHGELGAELDKLAIKPKDGLQILKQAFCMPNWHQLYVSSAPLAKRHHYWAHRGFLERTMNGTTTHPRPTLHNEYVAPTSPLQQRLALRWQSLLGIEKVGIHDSFFELGGHSLLALELINQLQTEFKYACSVVDLFEAPTIAQLANKMEPTTSTQQTMLAAANDRVKKQLAARNVARSH